MNDILWKSDVESSRQDQTQLDSLSESKKMSPLQAMLKGFVSRTEVLLVGCGW